MNDSFAQPDQQEESPFGTNLEYLRRNLLLTPEQRLTRYLAGIDEWRKIIDGAAEWRSQKFSNGSNAPGPATSS